MMFSNVQKAISPIIIKKTANDLLELSLLVLFYLLRNNGHLVGVSLAQISMSVSGCGKAR